MENEYVLENDIREESDDDEMEFEVALQEDPLPVTVAVPRTVGKFYTSRDETQ